MLRAMYVVTEGLVGTKKPIWGHSSVKSGRILRCIGQSWIASIIHEVGPPLITKTIYVRLRQAMLSSVACLESGFKRWTRLAKRNQIMSTVSDLKRSKSELITENLFLRQQLMVLERQVLRHRLTQHDRRVVGVAGESDAGLERGLGRGETRNAASMAPGGLQIVLAPPVI